MLTIVDKQVIVRFTESIISCFYDFSYGTFRNKDKYIFNKFMLLNLVSTLFFLSCRKHWIFKFFCIKLSFFTIDLLIKMLSLSDRIGSPDLWVISKFLMSLFIFNIFIYKWIKTIFLFLYLWLELYGDKERLHWELYNLQY